MGTDRDDEFTDDEDFAASDDVSVDDASDDDVDDLTDSEELDLADDDDFDDGDDDYYSDDDDYDDLEDASDDEIDFVVALYADDGERTSAPLDLQLANDLDELIMQLRRLPGDAGAVAMVSIDHQFFVIVRVRGRNVQVFLSDGVEANDWPIARDVADFLGEDIPDVDDDANPMGDFDLQAIADLDEDSDEQLSIVARRINFGPIFQRAVENSGR